MLSRVRWVCTLGRPDLDIRDSVTETFRRSRVDKRARHWAIAIGAWQHAAYCQRTAAFIVDNIRRVGRKPNQRHQLNSVMFTVAVPMAANCWPGETLKYSTTLAGSNVSVATAVSTTEPVAVPPET